MDLADRVLELLYDRGEMFFPRSELAAAAGVSPGALRRAVAELARRGQRLEQVPAAGVRLVRPLALDAHLIERALGTRRVGRHVLCFPEVDSTNDVAMEAGRQDGSDGLAVLAESQRHGRGRHGRKWLSPPRSGILLSVLLVDMGQLLPYEALTVAAGVATAEAVEAACGVSCRLKWPNDVILDGAKLAGAMVEVRHVGGRRCTVVGIGLNVNAAPPRLRRGEAQHRLGRLAAPPLPRNAGPADTSTAAGPATCLAEHLGGPVERIEVVRHLLRRLDDRVRQIEDRRLADLREAWLRRSSLLNERLAVRCGRQRHVGRVLDVSPLEGLVLLCDDGRTVHLPAASSTVLDAQA